MRYKPWLFLLGWLTLPSLPAQNVTSQQAVLLGVVQGVTEFLPVSSTGHMLLLNDICFKNFQLAGLNDYLVYINLGTLLALLLFYRPEIMQIGKGFCGCNKEGLHLGKTLILAFLPVACVGFLVDGLVQPYLYKKIWIAVALVFGGCAIFWIETYRKTHLRTLANLYEIPLSASVIIGCFQVFALWPGVSRSLATLIGCIYVGMQLQTAINFCFLLGFLTTGVVTFYKILKGWAVPIQTIELSVAILGIATAFVVGMMTIHMFLRLLNCYGLKPFGYYRLLLGLCLLLA